MHSTKKPLFVMTRRLSSHDSEYRCCHRDTLPTFDPQYPTRTVAVRKPGRISSGVGLNGTFDHSAMPSHTASLILLVCLLLAGSLPAFGSVPDLSGSWTVTQDVYLTISVEGDSETEHQVSTDIITMTQSGNTVSYYLDLQDPISGSTLRVQRTGTIEGNKVTFSGIAAVQIEGISYSKNSFVAVGIIQGNRIDASVTADVAFTYMGLSGTITGQGTAVFISNQPLPSAPVITGVSPGTGIQGTSLSNFTVIGRNLTATSTLSFSGSGVTVNSYGTRTASQMIASISIGAGAPLGQRNVTVTNPDGLSATLANAFTVDSSCISPLIWVHPTSTTIKTGEVIVLQVTATGAEPLKYEWYEGAQGDTAKPVGTNSAQFTSQPLSSSTSFWVRVRNSCGQADSQVAVITVRPVPVSQITLSLPPGGSVSTSTLGPAEELVAGYAVTTVSSGIIPYGTAVFSYKQNGVVVSEVGVPASPPTLSARFFVDSRAKVSQSMGGGTVDILTGFAAVNSNNTAAILNLRLRNSNGATLAQGVVRLNPGEHIAKFLDQLAPEFVLPSSFTTLGLGLLEITSDQPVSVLALRLTINQRGDLLLTSTPIADLAKPAPSGALSFPQIADGGGYRTTLIMMNTSNTTETGVIHFYSNSGSPLAVRMIDTAAADTRFPYSIPPGGFLRLVTDGSPANVSAGWALLIPDSGLNSPVSAAIFSFAQSGTLVTESGVPAVTPTTHARIYVDKSGGHDTGLAVANPGSASMRITATAYQSDGVTRAGSGQGTVDLLSMGHDAKFAGQVIPDLPPGFTGILDLSSPAPFTALTLRSLVNERGDFLLTTFPIADVTQLPPAPMIFPQIADGGGYQTQIILLSSGGPSNTALSLYGDDGKPLPAITGTPNVPANAPPGYAEQPSYTGDCGARPAGSICLKYPDGYVWLVYDSISGWGDVGSWQGKQIQVGYGFKADYYHVLGTLLIREVSR